MDAAEIMPWGFPTIRFPGQYYDEETGLHYNRFRYYDPSIGRYISADPIGQRAGPNLYTYAYNSPLNRIDSLGLDVEYRGASISNQGTRDRLSRVDQSFPNHDVVVTGGDRYRDENGVARETADNTPIPGSAPDSAHFGGTAVDVHLEGPAPVPSTAALEQALAAAGFDNYVSSNYSDGHTHGDYRDSLVCSTVDMQPVCQPPPPNSCEGP